MPRKNFAFSFAWAEATAHLSWDVRLEVYEAAISYAETGRTEELSAAAAKAFEKYIMPDFRRRAKSAEYRTRQRWWRNSVPVLTFRACLKYMLTLRSHISEGFWSWREGAMLWHCDRATASKAPERCEMEVIFFATMR